MADISGIVGSWTRYEDTITKTNSNDTLGKEDFLKLLVAQLTHQDPTNPMQDTEFVTQLATYSGLEQQMTMNKNLETLISATQSGNAASAVSLIGYTIGYTDEDGALQTGQVLFVDIIDGEPWIYTMNEHYIPFSKVEYVGPTLNSGGGEEEEKKKEEDPSGGTNGTETP